MTAPSCPISYGQIPYRTLLTRGSSGALQFPTTFPGIPTATDLPSLIRATNALRDVLRQLTTSLTVNNVYNPPPSFFKSKGNTYYNEYPAWTQISTLTVSGYVFHKEKSGTDQSQRVDQTQRVLVRRMNQVDYQNDQQEAPDFFWKYILPLDQQLGTPEERGT
jgi:hypothetical protein